METSIPEDEDFLPSTVPAKAKPEEEEDEYTPPTRSWDITPLSQEVRATMAELQKRQADNAKGEEDQQVYPSLLAPDVQGTLQKAKQRNADRPRRKSFTLLHEDPAIQDAIEFITASQELKMKR